MFWSARGSWSGFWRFVYTKQVVFPFSAKRSPIEPGRLFSPGWVNGLQRWERLISLRSLYLKIRMVSTRGSDRGMSFCSGRSYRAGPWAIYCNCNCWLAVLRSPFRRAGYHHKCQKFHWPSIGNRKKKWTEMYWKSVRRVCFCVLMRCYKISNIGSACQIFLIYVTNL